MAEKPTFPTLSFSGACCRTPVNRRQSGCPRFLPTSQLEAPPLMASKAVDPKLYLNFSLDAAVPENNIVRRLAAAVHFGLVRSAVNKHYRHTRQPSFDPSPL